MALHSQLISAKDFAFGVLIVILSGHAECVGKTIDFSNRVGRSAD
jgi:hypothetical protein